MIAVNVIVAVLSMVQVNQSGDAKTFHKHYREKSLITGIKLSLCLELGWVFLFMTTVSEQMSLYSYMQIFVAPQSVLVILGNLLIWKRVNGFKSWTESCVCSLRPRSSTAW